MSDKMLKMKSKKRKASGGQAANSKSSVVPCNEAVKVGKMVKVDHIGTSVVDLDEDGEELYYLEVAWLLREKLNDFVEGAKGGPPGLELRSLLKMAASRKIVSVDPNKMSPVLWKYLRKELQLLVLARLPLPDITRLRSLSKEWNRDMATVNSEFNRACDKTSSIMVAAFSWIDFFPTSELLITICDLSTRRSQYTYCLHLGYPMKVEEWNVMGAHDGGLVCFMSAWRPSKADPLCIVVMNLLTRVQRKLPPLLYDYSTLPEMMLIEVDSKTKCYRVVVVGKTMEGGRPTVEIFDSGAGQWTKTTPPLGFIFGDVCEWESYGRPSMTPYIYSCVFDFAKGQLERCDLTGPSRGASVMTHVVQKDCMFVLHRHTSNGEILPAGGYCITKYRIQNNLKDWVQERSYSCSPFETLSEKELCKIWTLTACEGFLMMLSGNGGHVWLLDLSTGEWRSLPNYFEGHHYGGPDSEIILSQAFWNVLP